MSYTHISQQFDEELDSLRQQVLSMGGLVESHVQGACNALVDANIVAAEKLIQNDFKVNAYEVAIDEKCVNIIARRQPAASDLRLVMAIVKTITDLERIGDEAEKIARMAIELAELERPKNNYAEIREIGGNVRKMLHDSLDAFARVNLEDALEVIAEDKNIDREYKTVVQDSMNLMMNDPRDVRRRLNILWAARALERIGDHSKNISEYVVYLIKGKDIRHTTLEQVKKELLNKR